VHSFFDKKGLELGPKSFRYVPECHNRRVALTQFQAANVGSIYTHPLSQGSLSKAGRDSQPLHIPSH
jgi:hypothetical protein